MSRFRRRNHDVPGLNLASMPDLIFTVLKAVWFTCISDILLMNKDR